jgi:hypothetical protein
MPPDPKQPVNFRIGNAYFKQLAELGEPLGLSPHEFARHLICQTLEDAGREDVLNAVSSVREEVAGLRRDLSESLNTILLQTVPNADGKEIRAWVSKNLGK